MTPEQLAAAKELEKKTAARLKDLRKALKGQPLSKPKSENERLREHMNRKNAAARDIDIWKCKDPKRRQACMDDPVEHMKVYFPDRFTRPFSHDQKEAIYSIVECARYGQDEIICAPRGDWKTETAKALIHYLMCAEIIKFPVIIGATRTDAEKKYLDIQDKFISEIFAGDFPEIAAPLLSLERTPSKARKMTYKGEYLNFEWKADGCTFPQIGIVPHTGEPSPYGLCAMEYRGLDASIRGINIKGRRPDMAFCDDLETEESAGSDKQIADRKDRLEKAVGGLAGGGETLCRIVLGTIQNQKCLTNKIRIKWGGKRYRAVLKWPGGFENIEEADMTLCDEYIDIYRDEKQSGSKLMERSHAFYLENRDAIEVGVEIANEHYKSDKTRPDGTLLEVSAFQSILNKWANNDKSYVLTEIQNDPPADADVETMGLTSKIVQSRINTMHQGVLHPHAECVTVGIDLGKYESHWVAANWLPGFTGFGHDYGVIDVNTTGNASAEAQERALYRSLMSWRNEMLSWEFQPTAVCVDSGAFTDVAYEFVRDAGAPFYATKGWDTGRFSHGKPTKDRRVGDNFYGQCQYNKFEDGGWIWLYHFNGDYWKRFVHQRFLTETLDEAGGYNEGGFSLFNPGRKKDGDYDLRRHISFAKHIVAEEYQTKFEQGKGLTSKWVQLTQANHWLDATVLMFLAARMSGVELGFDRPKLPPQPTATPSEPKPSRFAGPGGRPFLATQRSS